MDPHSYGVFWIHTSDAWNCIGHVEVNKTCPVATSNNGCEILRAVRLCASTNRLLTPSELPEPWRHANWEHSSEKDGSEGTFVFWEKPWSSSWETQCIIFFMGQSDFIWSVLWLNSIRRNLDIAIHISKKLLLCANSLACGWRHNSRKLLTILFDIQNAFDLEKWTIWIKKSRSLSMKRNFETQTERSLTPWTWLHDLNCCPELKPEINVFRMVRPRLPPRQLRAARNGRSRAALFAHINTSHCSFICSCCMQHWLHSAKLFLGS
jgi:hypothetical protein